MRQLALLAAIHSCTAPTPACFTALNDHCGVDNMMGFSCDGCVATHGSELQAAGCLHTDLLDFCEGVAAEPTACDQQLQIHCAITQSDCDKCTFCAYQQPACSLKQQRSFCKLMCGGTDGKKVDLGGGRFTFTQDEITSCMIAAEKVCGHTNDAAVGTTDACTQCVSSHLPQLRDASCDDTNGDGHLDAGDLMLQYFCSTSSCIPKLGDVCRSSTCSDCSSCAVSHRQKTGCRPSDEASFCKAMKPPAPKKDWWRGKQDPCLKALTQCNQTLAAARHNAPFSCIDLKKLAACAQAQAGSDCKPSELKAFGEASTCDNTLCGAHGSCNADSGGCECQPGVSGARCEVTPCMKQDCSGHGRCSMSPSTGTTSAYTLTRVAAFI